MYPDVLGNEIQKKVEYKLSSKKNYGHSSRHNLNEKVGKWFIKYYYLVLKVKKNNSTCSFLM